MNGYKIIEIPQRSQEWFDFRRGKIGSSDIASIMGVSPWETPYECWERILLDKKIPENAPMKRGIQLEARALQILNAQTGREYRPIVLQSLRSPDLICSLDAYWESPEGLIYIAEIKCPGKKTHNVAETGNIPDHYYPQLAYQQYVTSAVNTLYFSWDGESEEGEIVEYVKDEEYLIAMSSKIFGFLNSLAEFKSPEVTDKDWIETNDPIIQESVHEYSKIVSEISRLEVQRDLLKKEIVDRCGSSRTAVVGSDGSVFKIQKIMRKGAIDYDRLFKDYGIEGAEKYRKAPIETWKISK